MRNAAAVWRCLVFVTLCAGAWDVLAANGPFRFSTAIPRLEQPYYANPNSVSLDRTGLVHLCGPLGWQAVTQGGAVVRQSRHAAPDSGSQPVRCLADGPDGSLYRTTAFGTGSTALAKYTSAGELLFRFAETSSAFPVPAQRLASADDVAVSDDGSVFVADSFGGKVARYSAQTGAFELEFKSTGGPFGDFVAPTGIVALPGGEIVVYDNSTYYKMSGSGQLIDFESHSGPPLISEGGATLTLGLDGLIYAIGDWDSFFAEVFVVDQDLQFVRSFNLTQAVSLFSVTGEVGVAGTGEIYAPTKFPRGGLVRHGPAGNALETLSAAKPVGQGFLVPQQFEFLLNGDVLVYDIRFDDPSLSGSAQFKISRYTRGGEFVRHYAQPAICTAPRELAGLGDGSAIVMAFPPSGMTPPECARSASNSYYCFCTFDAAGEPNGTIPLNLTAYTLSDFKLASDKRAGSTRSYFGFRTFPGGGTTNYRVFPIDGRVPGTSWEASLGTDVLSVNGFGVDAQGRVVISYQTNAQLDRLTVRRYTGAGALVDSRVLLLGNALPRAQEVRRGAGTTFTSAGDIAFLDPPDYANDGSTSDPMRLRVFSGTTNVETFSTTIGSALGQTAVRVCCGAQLQLGFDGALDVADMDAFRVSIFTPTTVAAASRAVVVAGGGARLDGRANDLWDGTEASAGLGIRALTYQGFDKDTIQYLSPNLNNDVDGNGVFDDVDGLATLAGLQSAITGSFASTAQELVVYLVNHGGYDATTGKTTFRLNENERLDATQLDAWLDQWQSAHPLGRVIVVIDACESGRFLPILATSPNRFVVTSTAAGEDARFLYNGALSFSGAFFSQIIAGEDLASGFADARDLIREAFRVNGQALQTPRLDANGNGIADEAGDVTLATGVFIGNGVQQPSDRPTIGDVTLPAAISGPQTVTIDASGVTAANGVSRVWAVLRPPMPQGSPASTPEIDYPTVELASVGAGAYQGTTTRFDEAGTYDVRVFAQDSDGKVSDPAMRQLTVSSPARRKAVVAALGATGDSDYADIASNGDFVVRVLAQQGYGPTGQAGSTFATDETSYLRAGGIGTGGSDATPTLAALQGAITAFAGDGARDAVIYISGRRQGIGLRVNANETLSPAQLDGWLDTLQQTLPGPLTVVIDADDAGGFFADLVAPAGKERIVITSTGTNERALLGASGRISFTRQFWREVLDGETVHQAFVVAQQTAMHANQRPTAQIDDTGNGVPNEELVDGTELSLSGRVRLGNGVRLAGDPPFARTLIVATSLNGQATTPIRVEGVSATATLQGVEAVVRNPAGNDRTTVLAKTAPGVWEGTLDCLADAPGSYQLGVYARDENEGLSKPLQRTIAQATASTTVICDPVLATLFKDGFE